MTPLALAAAGAAALLLASPAPVGQAGQDIVERSVEASRTTPYVGEALWITFGEDRPYVTTVDVTASGEGEVVVEAPGRARVRVGQDGAEHQGEGWDVPLPGALDHADARFEALARNYRVEVEEEQRVMARRCTVLTFERRADGAVRERLWVDVDSGLPLRRETYAPDGSLLRLGTFLSLDLRPPSDDEAPSAPPDDPLHGVMPVDERELSALRRAGWTVPQELPGAYEAIAAFAVAAEGTQPLQVVYTDGLYTVSVFQQAGSADWESLPPGAQPVEGLPGEVYEWPGALPQRLVWTVDGRTWSLVGDAPPDDLRAVAGALPSAHEPGVVERLWRGLSRLWSGVSEWGKNLWSPNR